MKTIWQFELKLQESQDVRMPKGARIIHVGLDHLDQLCLWAIVNPNAIFTTRIILILSTGQLYYEGSTRYIGTVKKDQFMLHVFQEPE